MLKQLRLLSVTVILSIPTLSHALSLTYPKIPTTSIVPKTQVIAPPTESKLPSQLVITDSLSKNIIKDSVILTGQIVPPPTIPQAPTNNPSVVTRTTIPRTPLSTESRTVITQVLQKSTTDKIDFDFRTGGDNLEPKDCQRNPDLYLYVRGKDPIHIPNMNSGQTWPNNSVRRISIPLDGTIKIEDIESIKISRITPTRNNVCGIIADNWNLDKLTVTASIKTNGKTQRTILANIVPPVRGEPVFRFVYETRGVSNPNIGTSWTWTFNLPRETNTPVTSSTTPTNARIGATITTGGDDLRGGSDNINLILKFKSSTRSVTINNINDSASWGNWSENTVSKEIRNSLTLDINDIKSVEVRHSGGGGISADNWHVDKILINISKNGMSRTLVDKVGAPIHMFTGDTRRKVFVVGE